MATVSIFTMIFAVAISAVTLLQVGANAPRLPNHTGTIGNWRVTAANHECKNWCQSHHRGHQERLGEVRPRELRDRLTARPKSNEEREQLEEQIDGEKPAQVVRELHPEVASALLPDPLMLDGRGSWI